MFDVPPSAKAANATVVIRDCIQTHLQRTPGAPVYILCDFNHYKLETVFSGYEQYVKDNTKDKNVLDKCYGNIKEAYTSRLRPPLLNYVHKTVFLIPTYKTLLKRHKAMVKNVNVWSKDSVEALKGCFLCTDWEVFHSDDIDETTVVTTD